MSNEYMAEYMAKRRRDRRQKLEEMSGNVCARCSSIKDLEFNHIDRSTKTFDLCGRHLTRPWSQVVTEWEKCELLCRPCHLQYTKGQYEGGEIQSWNSLKHVPYVCGTARCYSEKPCRCDWCRAAKRAYRAKEIDYHSLVAQPAVASRC